MQGVTAKVYIQDEAVAFVAKHTDMGKREARKELARLICGYGSFNWWYLGVDEDGGIVMNSEESNSENESEFYFGDFDFEVEIR